MHDSPLLPPSTNALFTQEVTWPARLIGLSAAGVILAAASVAHVPLLMVLALPVALGALTVRGSTTSVEYGAVVTRYAPAPLRSGGVEIVPAESIRSIEVLSAHDSEAAPGRNVEYWVALRLSTRSRPLSVGERHFDRAQAESDAARLRAELGHHGG